MSITSVREIPGVYVGHATNAEAGTGCTVIVCPGGATPGVDVRGGAPATRETDLMRPEETVQTADAVVLAGGSAFGLAASVGVAEELERRGVGVNVGVTTVPIVGGACVFDLGCGRADVRPTVADGVAAAVAAFEQAGDTLERGNVGAGTGCTVGKAAGPARTMKSGLGECVREAGSLVCGAIAAVNALGDVYDPATGKPVAGVLAEDGTLAANTVDLVLAMQEEADLARTHASGEGDVSAPRTNTTISCVVTNARLTKAEATKVAQIAADAYAHTIRPVHTTNDGDAIFVLATGETEAHVDVVGLLATRALEGAILDAVRSATSAYGYPAACDLPEPATGERPSERAIPAFLAEISSRTK